MKKFLDYIALGIIYLVCLTCVVVLIAGVVYTFIILPQFFFVIALARAHQWSLDRVYNMEER